MIIGWVFTSIQVRKLLKAKVSHDDTTSIRQDLIRNRTSIAHNTKRIHGLKNVPKYKKSDKVYYAGSKWTVLLNPTVEAYDNGSHAKYRYAYMYSIGDDNQILKIAEHNLNK